MVMASTNGLMAENSQATGFAIRCMARAFSHGLTVEDTKASTTMIKSKVMAFSLGQMEGNTTEPG